MEFWHLNKYYEDYDSDYQDSYCIHYKTKEEAEEDFFSLLAGYKDNYIDEENITLTDEGDYKDFEITTDYCYCCVVLEKIKL